MSNSSQLEISTPRQQDFRNPEAILNPRDLRAWLQNLPLLKPIPTVSQIRSHADITNTQRITEKQRHQLLELYRDISLQMFYSSDLETLRRLSLKEPDRKRVQEEIGRLCLAVADGYKVIIRDQLEKNGKSVDAKLLFHAIYCTMEMLAYAILNSYRGYQAPPPRAFAELHQLYLYGEQHDLLDISVPAEGGLAADTLGKLYRQIIVLSTLDPYHLPDGYATKLFQRLQGLASYCTISSLEPGPDTEEVYVVDMMLDEAPRPVYKLPQGMEMRRARVFDTQPLGNKARAEITIHKSQPAGISTEEDIQILSRLIPPSTEERTRKSERTQSQRNCKVTFGPDAVHHFLSVEQQALKQNLEASVDRFGPYPVENWRVENESTNGYMLSYHQDSKYEIRVGDIICVLNTDTENLQVRGHIAIIRWLRHLEDKRMQTGVEIIPGNILPMSCRVIEGDKVSVNTYRAIFISSVPALGQAASMITPKGLYHRKQIMEVSISEQPMRIETGYLIEDTLTFDRFNFTSVTS